MNSPPRFSRYSIRFYALIVAPIWSDVFGYQNERLARFDDGVDDFANLFTRH
jgi:hypothetical protein